MTGPLEGDIKKGLVQTKGKHLAVARGELERREAERSVKKGFKSSTSCSSKHADMFVANAV